MREQNFKFIYVLNDKNYYFINWFLYFSFTSCGCFQQLKPLFRCQLMVHVMCVLVSHMKIEVNLINWANFSATTKKRDHDIFCNWTFAGSFSKKIKKIILLKWVEYFFGGYLSNKKFSLIVNWIITKCLLLHDQLVLILALYIYKVI
jgi:hypothetical protein